MGEKTEKATPKKLKDAKKKGQVAKSQDLPSAFTFIVSIALVLALSGYLYNYVGGFIETAFKSISKENVLMVIPIIFKEGIFTIFYTVIPILGLVSMVGVLVNFLAIGPVFAVEVFKFDIKKFDMVQNLKSKFKMKTLFELVKSIFKISVAAYIIYGVMYKSLPVLTQAAKIPMSGALAIFYAFLLEVIIKVGIFFIGIAVLDFAYQKYNFGKEMKMEKFEVKQEYKNTEGDPQIKGKRKQIAQEIAYSDGPAGGVKKAAAVVTNPVQLAVAIGYERELDAAPYILAMGEGILAERIIHYAEKYDIPVIRNIKLAHQLWQEGDIYDYIPEDTYEAMAEILRWISSLEEEYDFEEDIDIDVEEEEE
ncbi:MAG: type III secretion system export apparatus subunit SctU [Waddliaceae bacterium]